MENAEEVFQSLEEFSKRRPKAIPRELEDYLGFVARTGDPVYQWALIKHLFKEKLLNVITEFYETSPGLDIPHCPNVDVFNYEIMKNCLLEKIDAFPSAPFTIQRICELLTAPRKQYNRIDKFMRAFEKNILVVSTCDPGPLRHSESENGEAPESLVNGSDSNSDYNVDVEMEDMSSWKENADPLQSYAIQSGSSISGRSADSDNLQYSSQNGPALAPVAAATSASEVMAVEPDSAAADDLPESSTSDSDLSPPDLESNKSSDEDSDKNEPMVTASTVITITPPEAEDISADAVKPEDVLPAEDQYKPSGGGECSTSLPDTPPDDPINKSDIEQDIPATSEAVLEEDSLLKEVEMPVVDSQSSLQNTVEEKSSVENVNIIQEPVPVVPESIADAPIPDTSSQNIEMETSSSVPTESTEDGIDSNIISEDVLPDTGHISPPPESPVTTESAVTTTQERAASNPEPEDMECLQSKNDVDSTEDYQAAGSPLQKTEITTDIAPTVSEENNVDSSITDPEPMATQIAAAVSTTEVTIVETPQDNTPESTSEDPVKIAVETPSLELHEESENALNVAPIEADIQTIEDVPKAEDVQKTMDEEISSQISEVAAPSPGSLQPDSSQTTEDS